MNSTLWIFLAGLIAFVLFQTVSGVRRGKRERSRLEALFERVAGCSCPLCNKIFGNAVREGTQLSFGDEHQLPPSLMKVDRLCTWRITCPHCKENVLLAEADDVFELLRAIPTQPKHLTPAYLTLLIVLTIAVLGASVYSMVRFFTR